VDKLWIIFRDDLIGVRDKLIPRRSLPRRSFLCWMKFLFKTGIKKRNKAWSNFNNYHSYQNKEKYRKLQNSVNKDIRNAKRNQSIKQSITSFFSMLARVGQFDPQQLLHCPYQANGSIRYIPYFLISHFTYCSHVFFGLPLPLNL